MPVDDHIYIVRNRGVHRGIGCFLHLRRVREIAALARVHRDAEQVCAVGRRVRNRLTADVLRKPLDAVTAHAVQLDRRALLIAELRALDLKPAVL